MGRLRTEGYLQKNPAHFEESQLYITSQIYITKAFRNKICKSPETYFLMIIRNRLPECALSDEGESVSLCFPKSRKKSTKSAKNPKKRKKIYNRSSRYRHPFDLIFVLN